MEYALGVLISLIVQGFKTTKNKYVAYILLALLSLVGGGLYVYFSGTSYWPLIVKVILVASTFHNLVLRRFEDSTQ